jgi:hypothetical protein
MFMVATAFGKSNANLHTHITELAMSVPYIVLSLAALLAITAVIAFRWIASMSPVVEPKPLARPAAERVSAPEVEQSAVVERTRREPRQRDRLASTNAETPNARYRDRMASTHAETPQARSRASAGGG